eukprot:scaffold284210_cov17-Tisochrysis_lutea.AAC.1
MGCAYSARGTQMMGIVEGKKAAESWNYLCKHFHAAVPLHCIVCMSCCDWFYCKFIFVCHTEKGLGIKGCCPRFRGVSRPPPACAIVSCTGASCQ